MKDLSIIILSYNTKEITSRCLQSLLNSLNGSKSKIEIFIVDNGSTDGSVEILEGFARKNTNKNLESFLTITIIQSKENLGFSKANNKAFKQSTGRYILFLNSDIIVENVNFDDLIEYMDNSSDVGALTVRVNLLNGKIDPASHRGFPTVWRSFCYFSGFERMLGKVPVMKKYLAGYHLLNKDLSTEHEIDSPSGAFLLGRRDILSELEGFDENFFMYGEDIDLSYRIKQKGYKIMYIPRYSVTHLKYTSGLKNIDSNVRKTINNHFYEAMKIFYKKHYETKYPKIINNLVYFFINTKNKLP